MTNWKAIVFGLVLTAMVPLASAACWDIQYMPTGTWDYSAWLCNSSQVVGYWVNMYGQSGPFSMMLHGQIETAAPSGHPQYGNTYRVYLQGFNYASPYPATLKCYKRMGVPGNYWWMYTGQQVTLYAGQCTSNSGSWVLAGCPPISNGAQQGGSPPQVRIDVSWYGFGGRRNAAISAPDYTSVGIPFFGYLDGYSDALAGRTASVLKTKRARR